MSMTNSQDQCNKKCHAQSMINVYLCNRPCHLAGITETTFPVPGHVVMVVDVQIVWDDCSCALWRKPMNSCHFITETRIYYCTAYMYEYRLRNCAPVVFADKQDDKKYLV